MLCEILGNIRAMNNVRVMQTMAHMEEIKAERNSEERITDASVLLRVERVARLLGLVSRMGRKWTYRVVDDLLVTMVLVNRRNFAHTGA